MGMINSIIHGDCLEVMERIPDGVIDLIVTDPPYGIDYQSNRQGIDRKKSNQRLGDEVIRDKYFQKIQNDEKVPLDWMINAFRVLKPNCAIYIFCRWDTWHENYFGAINVGFNVKNMIVLNKSNHGMGDLKGSYAPKHELLLFAVKGRHILRFPKRIDDVWDVPVKFSGAIRLHPNEKPESWILPAIEYSSKENSIVLDPFIGSGTTSVVCIKTGRRFVGIEKDQHYYEVAKKRVEECQNSLMIS